MEGGLAMTVARIKFTKGEPVKYISHLDLQRAFQRALRRAEIDISYSQGFNPHPKLSFAMALSVGMTSEGEYLDIEMDSSYEGQELIKKLNQVLPKGFEVTQCALSDKKHPSLMSTIRMGLYQVVLHTANPPSPSEIQVRIETFLLQKEIQIQRTNKRGKTVEKNIRPLIYRIALEKIEGKNIYMTLELATGSQGNLKAEIAVNQLACFGDIALDYDSIKVHRVDLFAQAEGKFISPIQLFD